MNKYAAIGTNTKSVYAMGNHAFVRRYLQKHYPTYGERVKGVRYGKVKMERLKKSIFDEPIKISSLKGMSEK